MDMSLVFLIAVGFLACSMAMGLYQTATIVVRRRSVKGRRTRKNEKGTGLSFSPYA
jgi:hypothetical protein